MKKLHLLSTLALSAAFSVGSAQVVLMPDSTNNLLVAFDPTNGSVVNSNVFGLAGGTPIHAMTVGSEIWVSEQLGDRVSRWAFDGTALGQLSGAMDNVRGMGMANGEIYVTNDGTGNGAPGPALYRFDQLGTNMGSFATPSSSPFHVLEHQGGILVASDAANDDVHRYTYAGASIGTFHNSTSLNFAEQMTHDLSGNVLVAGFSSNNIVRLDPNTGAIINSFTASGARGVFQLSNGNILWTNGSGAHVLDVNTGGSTQVHTGGGRFLELSPVPEPATFVALAVGIAVLAFRRRR